MAIPCACMFPVVNTSSNEPRCGVCGRPIRLWNTAAAGGGAVRVGDKIVNVTIVDKKAGNR